MKYIFTLLFVSFSLLLASQNATFKHKGKEFTIDTRVEKFLGSQKVTEYITSSTFKLVYFNFFVEHSFEFINELPADKNLNIQTRTFSTTNIAEFDILKEGIEPTENNQYFAFGNKYLMVYSQNSFNQKLEQFIQSLNQ
mgnify:CR=1 FL=1